MAGKISRLGTSLRHFRAERGLTVQRLADLAGVEESTIRDLEQGRTQHAQARTIGKFARVLGVSIEALDGEAR